MSAYEDYMNGLAKQDGAQQRLVSSLSEAATVNPDEFANQVKLSKAAAISLDALPQYKDEAQQAKLLGEVGLERLWKDAPKTSGFLSHPDNAKLSHDDTDNLSGFEKAANILKNSGRAVAAAVPQMNAGLWGAAAAPFELVGADGIGGYLRDQQKITQGMAKAWGPQGTPSGNIEAGWYSGLTSAGSNLMTLPLAFLPGGQNAALSAMVAPVFGDAYGKARDKGLTPLQGINYGAQDAAAEWAGEKLGLGSLVKNVKVGSGFGKTLAEYIAREVPSEMATTLAQSFNEYTNINPEKPVVEWLKQLPDELAQTVVATLVGGGAITTTVKVADKALQAMVGKQQDAQQAGQMGDLLGELNKMAEASKLRERDTVTAQGFFQSVLDEGRDSVYITPDELAQSGLAERMAQLIPAVQEQLVTAAESGHDIRIPIADLMATMAGPELEQSILPHVAVEPGGFTPTTSQEYLQSDHAQELQAEVERVLGEKQGDDTFKQSAAAVKTTIKDQLTTAGRFTDSVNDAYSSMVGNFYAVQAARMGTTPEAMFERYPLKIGAESIAGQQFDQSGRLVTDTPAFKNWFGDWAHPKAFTSKYPADMTPVSQAVGEDGKPLVLYHSTNGDFSTFEPGRPTINSTTFGDLETERHGIFTTPDVKFSEEYLKSGPGKNVMPVFMDIKSPIDMQHGMDGETIRDIVENSDGKINRNDFYNLPVTDHWQLFDGDFGKNFVEAAKKAGYDGAIMRELDLDRETDHEVYVAFDPTQIKSATGNRGTFDPNDPNILNQSAFHGTPYKFDKFSLAHIGRGEGAQAFGWGLYFAGKKQVAEYYRKTLSDSSSHQTVYLNGQKLEENTPERHAASLLYFNDAREIKPMAKQWIKEAAAGDLGLNDTAKKAGMSGPEYFQRLSDFVQKHKKKEITFAKGQLYEVSIPEDDDMLQWHKPITSQPESVKKALKDSGLWQELKDNLSDFGSPMNTRGKLNGENIYAYLEWKLGSDKAASLRLNELGIPGLKYPAGSIAGTGTGNGGFNYVVFDENAVDILQTYYQNEKAARGSFNPATLQLTLLKTADLSTFLHESGHFFLEVQADLAGQLMQDAAIHGADTLKPGEQQVLKDMQATLDWFGIKDLAEWNNLDFEEKRSYHEQWARGFEAYLFDGKAPAIEMQGVFHRFRAWLLNVYKDLNALNVELTDEVRGVFDRMLATGEQITLAEQGRSMMPLFTSAEQIGMTPDEFADYQALGTDATNEAIEELQARGLRDMQWIDNARGRIIKRLKQESKEKRAEVQMEVRAEVMRQPIYRAWSFLTGKLSADDKIENQKPISSSPPSVLDETIDSLFVAIAKLGGLNKDEVVSTWGTDPADKPASGVFGKPVWRVEGGLSIDGMAEALSQYGYLPLDENGKVDLADFEAMFDAEVRGDPQYSNAYAPEQFIRPGDQVSNPGAVQAGRLAMESLDSMGFPAELVNHLKALRMTAKDGWHPDLVAERFGFESGEDMIRQIAVAEAPKAEIEALTDQRMLERFGDLSSDEAIKKAADKAIHNEARARMLSTELNALENATGKRKTLASAAKEYAAAMIARLKVGNIRPDIYASSAVRSGKASEKASRSGDIQTAAAEKRNQIISHFGTKAAHEAKAEVEALRRKWSDLANRADDKLKKSYDMDLVNAVRAILGEYGIAEKKAKRAIDYLETVKTQDPEMYGIVSASIDAAAMNAKPFKEMTVEEVRGLGDEIDSILHLAKRVRQMEVDGDLIDRQEVEDALRGRMEEIGVPDAMPGDTSAITEGETRMVKFRTALAALTRVESWVGKMDGMAAFGPFRRFVYSRIKDSADAYRSDKAKHLKQFRDLFDAIATTMKTGLISAPELGYTFGKDNGGSAVNELMHAILHTGNDSNMRKLLLGRNWAQDRDDGSLDTSRWDAFIQRMANEGKITKAHFDFAQGVWDLLESTKPMAQKTHRDVFGKYFDEVTARPLKTPFGMYAGGYVPAQADARIVADANMRALAEAENQSMQFAFPTTSKGFTKGRVDYNKPLLLDLRTLAQHIDKVLLFSHMEMPVRDVQRVLSSVGGTLNKIDPVAIPAMLTPWLNRAAKQQVTTPITADAGLSRFLSVARSRAGAAAMFGNLANAVQQITGFSMAALKVRPSLMLSSTADFVKGPRDFVAAVSESSPYMAERLSSEVAAMSDDINQILLNPSLLEQGQAWTMKHAYFLQTAIDSCMSPIIWTAAYNQAVEQGMEHKDAVRLGDSAVRETQGSTLPEDISRIEAGPAWARLFTQFAGYFNMQANLLGTEFAKVMQEYGLKKGAGKGMYILTFGFLAPAIVGELIMQLFRGGPGDDDKDGEYLDDWLASLFIFAPMRNATAMLPGVGQLINSSVNAWNSKPYDDRIASSPAVSMVESAVKSPVSVYQAIANDGSPQKAVRDVATLISMSVGLPANLAARPIGYMAGMADNRIVPTSGADMARGLVTGMASPESKR